MDNLIIINAPFGARGHQVGRLLSSCNNVLWFDHFKNGSQPWFPSLGLGRTFSKYHYTRRFEGAYGIGTDDKTFPPVLERARATKSNPYPIDKISNWSEKIYPNYVTVVLHDDLKETKKLFPKAKHVIIKPDNIPEIITRLNTVGADYRWGKEPHETLRYAFTKDGKSFEENMHVELERIVTSYNNADEHDIVINSAKEILNEDFFKTICTKFNLTFNQEAYKKVYNFVVSDRAAPTYETHQVWKKDLLDIEVFLSKCADKGYNNNKSLQTIKFDWCINEGGCWWATYKNKEIISLSGIHPFKDGYRALFRGAQLESRPYAPINKYQMQIWGMYAHLPMQIEWAKWQGNNNIYITTNVYNDASGTMNRMHKSFNALEKSGVVEYCGDEEIFYTQQSVWKVNIEKYFEVRKIYEG